MLKILLDMDSFELRGICSSEGRADDFSCTLF